MKIKVVLILFISTVFCVAYSQNTDLGKFIPSDCPLELPEELLGSGKFLYGSMEVPQYANTLDVKTVKLAVAIFKCRADNATHEPLVLCSGGPGTSNIDGFVPDLAGGLGDLFLNERDVVIIESRGLKYSEPYLKIRGLEELQLSLLKKNLNADETIALYMDSISASYNRFNNQGIDLSAFNSLETSNEIAYVMKQLGYGKFSMFGTSYGTEIAQYVLMNHSDQLASVVMNGVMDINLGGYHMHTSLISTLDAMFNLTDNDPKYAGVFPNLKANFLGLIKRLNEKPVTISAKYGADGKTRKILLTGSRLSVWLFNQMYHNTQLPLTLHKITSGDYSPIIESPGLIFPVPGFSMGLSLSMFLSETSDIKPENIPIEGEYAELVKGTSTTMFGPYFWNKTKEVWKV
ncbi:MAG: alpha/beta fold hydrolase, partial [Maribacter sp.]|nr:alpha/beta fold hydrolase [Maribacter sp.]